MLVLLTESLVEILVPNLSYLNIKYSMSHGGVAEKVGFSLLPE